MEPISMILAAAAAGGVASKLAEKATDYVSDLVRGQDPKVQARAAENAAAFVAALSAELSRHEGRQRGLSEEQLDATMEDPDVASTVRSALIGAARTSSAEKHAALAFAVAERLSAPAESNEALASAIAVDAIPKLSSAHLRFLGIATVVFVIRPEPNWLLERDGEVGPATPPDEPFSQWLATALERLHLGITLDHLEVAHLVAAGCITYEQKIRRDLHAILVTERSSYADPRAFLSENGVRYDVGEFLFLHPIGKDLSRLWDFGLQHVTLTPAGRLVGTAVYQAVGGNPNDVEWSREKKVHDKTINDTVWDGRSIREDFLTALDRAIKDRAERRVGPWSRLDPG